jgi:hypothetical protein
MCLTGSIPEAMKAAAMERVWPLQVLVDQLGGDRVHVDDAEDAVMLVLQRHELADGAKIVAQMQIAGRLDAGEDERLESGGHDVLPPGLWRARIPR